MAFCKSKQKWRFPIFTHKNTHAHIYSVCVRERIHSRSYNIGNFLVLWLGGGFINVKEGKGQTWVTNKSVVNQGL